MKSKLVVLCVSSGLSGPDQGSNPSRIEQLCEQALGYYGARDPRPQHLARIVQQKAF